MREPANATNLASLADGKEFSFHCEEKSWEFMLVDPMLLCPVAKLHFGDHLMNESGFPFSKQLSTGFWTWNRIQVVSGRAATVGWIVRCDCSHDQIPLLILERPMEGLTFHVASPFSVTGVVEIKQIKNDSHHTLYIG
jgi:hypothetical protein